MKDQTLDEQESAIDRMNREREDRYQQYYRDLEDDQVQEQIRDGLTHLVKGYELKIMHGGVVLPKEEIRELDLDEICDPEIDLERFNNKTVDAKFCSIDKIFKLGSDKSTSESEDA